MDDKPVKVTAKILGEDYTIRGHAPEGHIEKVARYVDERMREIAEAYPKLGTSRVAVLAAINMADELYKLREQYEQLTQLLEEEWSRRHNSPGAAESGRLGGGSREGVADRPGTGGREAAAAGEPGRRQPVQVPAFGEPADRPGQLFTGDALTSRPGAGEPAGDWDPEADEDQ